MSQVISQSHRRTVTRSRSFLNFRSSIPGDTMTRHTLAMQRRGRSIASPLLRPGAARAIGCLLFTFEKPVQPLAVLVALVDHSGLHD